MKKTTKLGLMMAIMMTFISQSVIAKKVDYLGDIELKEVTMQDAVRILSELSGKNVIVTKDAAETIFSLYIRDASLVDAIDSMCRVTGLWYRKDADTNVYIVMTAEQFKEDVLVYRNESTKVFTLKHQNVVSAANAIKALFGSRVLLEEPENGGSYRFDGDMGNASTATGGSTTNLLNNISNSRSALDTDELSGGVQALDGALTANKLEQIGGRTILNESDVTGLVQAAPIRVTYNSLHNLLLVRSSDEKALEDVQQLIKEMDQPAKQVLLQMKIMRVALGENEDSVFDFQYTSNVTRQNGNNGPSSSTADNPLGGGVLPDNLLGLGMKPDQMASGSLVFQVVKSDWLAKLAFLETENRTKLISTPLIMASNNKEAEIFIGEQRPLVENVSSTGGTVSNGVLQPLVVTTQTTKKDVGTKLKIWPRINSDATVTLDIEQEISNINVGAATIPVATGGASLEEYSIDTFTTTKLNLTAIAKHGQTIAVGGLIEENSGDGRRGIPGISDIPGLGDLLSSDEKEFSRSELVILIKPFIYDSADVKSEGLQNIKKEMVLEESMDLIEEEARKSSNYKSQDAQAQLADMERVAQLINQLMKDSKAFQSRVGIDWKYGDLLVSSLGSAYKDGLYFTQVLVTNQGDSELPLTETSLGDYWRGLAWVFKKDEKRSVLKAMDRRVAIVISKQSVEQVLSDRQVPMRYVMSGGIQ